MLAKVTGTAQFTADTRHPGALFAAARSNPGLWAGVRSFDGTAALAMPGVVAVVDVPNGVAVVAGSTWAALKAMEAVVSEWKEAPYAATDAEMMAEVTASFVAERQTAGTAMMAMLRRRCPPMRSRRNIRCPILRMRRWSR